MPNYWESSARPLFVKTVFINGNRHAILSQEDPMLHSSLKKQSRPNSSMTMASILSISSLESPEPSSDIRRRNSKADVRFKSEKDMSSQLQSCLIKLRLPSGVNRENSTSRDEVILFDTQEKTEESNSKKASLKQRRKKWNGKPTRKKSCGYLNGNHTQENKSEVSGNTNETNSCCYVYNSENTRGKRSYCFVKISSKPHLTAECSCEKNLGRPHEFCGSENIPTSDKNNFVISATFHNLIMTANPKEKLSQNTSDCLVPIMNSDSSEIYWNNYFTKTYYNSLSERVIQWIDLANKRKNRERIPETAAPENSTGCLERIFAGRMFVGDINQSKCLDKQCGKSENKIKTEKEQLTLGKSQEEDVETEVRGEGNVETALSKEIIKDYFNEMNHIKLEKRQSFQNKQEELKNENTEMNSIPVNVDSYCFKSSYLQNSIINSFNPNILKSTKDQNSIFEEDSKVILKKPRTIKEKRSLLQKQPRCIETEDSSTSDESDFKITAIKCWEKKVSSNTNLIEDVSETKAGGFEKFTEEYVKRLKNRNWSQDFENNSKQINNSNITRSKIIFNQNWLSPQQNKASLLKERKAIWPQEKTPGRPQLHIFIPFLPTKDSSDDSISERGSFLEELS